MNVAPSAHFTSAPLDADKTFNAQPVMFGFPTPRNQFTYTSPPWDCDYQQQAPMVQVVLPLPPHMCYSPHPVYPMSPIPDQSVPLSAATIPDQTVPLSSMQADQSVPLSAMPEPNVQMTAMPDQVVTPQSPNVPMFVFSPTTYTQHPLQHPAFPNMQMGMIPEPQAQFFARSSTSVSPPPPTMIVEEPLQRGNKRTPPGFEKSSYKSPSPVKERRPLQSRSENQSENPRRRNSKRKSKKQSEKLADGEYRPSYRSKQDMIDKVFLALSNKYTALGLLENKGLRGDDTIRVHVKNFKALTRIEEALIAVESHPKVTVSRVSLPFSFRNEFQKKGFLVYLKLEDVTMVPHAQSVFRQYDEFKKCGVMRETGQYVESLPLAQATKPSASPESATPEWEPSAVEKESTPDYASETESASSADLAESDSEQLSSKPVISESFGPLTALASTRQQAMQRKASETNTNLTVQALMRAGRRTIENHASKSGLDRASFSFVDLQKLTHGEAGL